MKRKITVKRNTLRFSAAHFTTFGGDGEPLHGHNYDLFVEVEGDLTADGWVFDFVELKRVVAGLCGQLDHRFLLPLRNPSLSITESGGAYEIALQGRRYVIPRADVAPVPIDNSTAERLAEWFAVSLTNQLRQRGATNISAITVAVEEAPGQAAWCTLSLGPPVARKEEGGRRKEM